MLELSNAKRRLLALCRCVVAEVVVRGVYFFKSDQLYFHYSFYFGNEWELMGFNGS
jgi:hypothetical protein